MQGKTGIVYNNVYKNQNQNAIGEAIEFMLGFSAGVHFFIADNWSIDVEATYQHISNSGLARRNDGNNAAGALLGMTYFS